MITIDPDIDNRPCRRCINWHVSCCCILSSPQRDCRDRNYGFFKPKTVVKKVDWFDFITTEEMTI